MKFSENKKKYKGLAPKPAFPQTINELIYGPAYFPNIGALPDRTNTDFVRSREFSQLLADAFQDGNERSQTERRLAELHELNRQVAQDQNVPLQYVMAQNPVPPRDDVEFFDANDGNGNGANDGIFQRMRRGVEGADGFVRGLFQRRQQIIDVNP